MKNRRESKRQPVRSLQKRAKRHPMQEELEGRVRDATPVEIARQHVAPVRALGNEPRLLDEAG